MLAILTSRVYIPRPAFFGLGQPAVLASLRAWLIISPYLYHYPHLSRLQFECPAKGNMVKSATATRVTRVFPTHTQRRKGLAFI